ncbi:hypothetical protein IFM89_027187 [Coptis chinensis]|uniref:Uncharacterized protein n=1 Tax=Coptis chinensis TaxID=261450 RepID=A0A835M197_9MAGN|nr:hypothetical protein IFM89_027187 [Coptis chinensis]
MFSSMRWMDSLFTYKEKVIAYLINGHHSDKRLRAQEKGGQETETPALHSNDGRLVRVGETEKGRFTALAALAAKERRLLGNKARKAYEQSAKVIENSEGARTTPSLVAFNQKGNFSLALPAKRRSVNKPDKHVLYNKAIPPDPSTLPNYPPKARSLILNSDDEEARRQRAKYGKGRESNMGGGIRETPTPQQIQM